MTTSMKSLCMAAAVVGMLGGTSVRMQAQPVSEHASEANVAIASGIVGATPQTTDRTRRNTLAKA